MDLQAFGGFHGHSGLIQVVGRGGLRRRGRCRGRPSGAAAHPAGEPSHAGHPTCKESLKVWLGLVSLVPLLPGQSD